MASIIRIKRSTSATAPGAGTLNYGEIAASFGGGTSANNGERLFVGDSSNNPIIIGGKYFADLIGDNAPGEVEAGANLTTVTNGFIPIMDRSSNGNPGGGGVVNNLPRVDQWSVDKITIDANEIKTNGTGGTSADEDLIFRTNGTGEVIIPDDKFLSFGDGKDAKIEYDEDGTDNVRVTGADWIFDNVAIKLVGGTEIDNIGISSNVISTKSGGGNTLYIDPYPDGLSSDGLVIVKGSLQVDGTTTTVNSTSSTLNDAVIHLGDVTSKLTIMTYDVASGVSTMTVDRTVGINTGDLLAASGLPNSGVTTVTGYDTTTKVITFTGTTTAGISTGSQITVTHAYDTNTDRGISYSYNESSGSGNNKEGFFGYIDSAGSAANGGNTNVPERAWTYIPEAAITGNVATGVRGFIDIKGIYYQGASGGDWSASGATYFDAAGKLTSTGTPASGITTSNYLLTTNAAGIPVWTTTLDGGTF